MCGIAGFSLSKTEKVNARMLAANLLIGIEHRGRDATGAAWLDYSERKVRLQKKAVPASAFVDTLTLQPGTRLAVLHTRYATQGTPKNPLNNHPIRVGNVVGVHNGHIGNDDEIIARLGHERRGEVDTEAAFALIAKSGQHPTQVLGDLWGRAALAWLDAKKPTTLHLCRVCGSPLVIAHTAKGSLLFASERQTIQAAAVKTRLQVSWMEEVQEGTYLEVRDGVIHEFTPLEEFAIA